MSTQVTGLIIKAQSGFFTVRTEQGDDVVSQLPGRLKKEQQQTDIATIGDRVTISILPDKAGIIESVAPRERWLSRARSTGRDKRDISYEREQVLIANPDQIVLVFSTRQPEPHLRKLDRMLVLVERQQLPAIICVTKLDLAKPQEAEKLFKLYEDIGYPVIYTSAKTGLGLVQLREQLHHKLSALTGSSGVGKSSLLNALQPGLGLKVKEVSQTTTKGLHTTRYSELIPFAEGYVADTPGIRGVALYDIEPTEIDGYFREIVPFVSHCQFSDCTHQHEPNCAVLKALEQGQISEDRYDSYLRLWEEQTALAQATY